MKVNYIYHYRDIYGGNRNIRLVVLDLLQMEKDDDGYEVWRCETIESISEMTGWLSIYQLAVF